VKEASVKKYTVYVDDDVLEWFWTHKDRVGCPVAEAIRRVLRAHVD